MKKALKAIRARALALSAWGVAVLLLPLALASGAFASEVQVGGKLDHRLFYTADPSTVTQNETRYELTVEARPGPDGRVYLSWKGTVPFLEEKRFDGSETAGTSPAQLAPTLHEAYFDVYFPAADLRVGRQIINWGTADGINPTNVINPHTLSTDALVEREAAAIPVPAVRLSGGLGRSLGLTAVGILDFVPAPFPADPVRRLAESIAANVPPGGTVPGESWLDIEGVGPGNQYEFALRAESMVAGYNVYASYFNGYTDLPALWMEPISGPPVAFKVSGRYRRQQQFGLATAGTVGDGGVWLEAAYTLPEKLDRLDLPAPASIALSSNEGTWQAVAGSDYTFASDVYVSGQLVYDQAGSLLLPYAPPGQKEAGLYGVGVLQYTPERSSTTWDVVSVVNLRDGGAVVAPGLTHELEPGVKLAVRYVDVVGGADTEFGGMRPQIRGVAARVEAAF
ncbi:MAG: hypothetical protein IMX02_01255 [Limnochordaceae bacterium]|nr:hypothetical protein [Limnochordaceae bacterium]